MAHGFEDNGFTSNGFVTETHITLSQSVSFKYNSSLEGTSFAKDQIEETSTNVNVKLR